MKYLDNQKLSGEQKGISRRHFIKIAGISTIGISSLGYINLKTKGVSIITEPADHTAHLGRGDHCGRLPVRRAEGAPLRRRGHDPGRLEENRFRCDCDQGQKREPDRHQD